LLPFWRPDVVWGDKAVRVIPSPCFDRPVRALEAFLRGSESRARTGAYKYERAFGSVLEELQAVCGLRQLAAASEGLRFRILLEATSQAGEFQLTGLD
jgi:hypothetical protein